MNADMSFKINQFVPLHLCAEHMQYQQIATKIKKNITVCIVQPNSIWTRILLKIAHFVRVWGEIMVSQIYKYCMYFKIRC